MLSHRISDIGLNKISHGAYEAGSAGQCRLLDRLHDVSPLGPFSII